MIARTDGRRGDAGTDISKPGGAGDVVRDLRFEFALAHLLLLFPDPVGLVELRTKSIVADQWAQHFRPATELDAVARLALRLSPNHEVYVGVLPRDRPRGGRADLRPKGTTAWVDLDTEHATQRAMTFDPPPTLMLRSGGPGHAHAYWALDRAVPLERVEAVNVAVAERVGGDAASTAAPRVLRLAGTFAHKYEPPVVIAPVPRVGDFDIQRQRTDGDCGADDHCGDAFGGARVPVEDLLRFVHEEPEPEREPSVVSRPAPWPARSSGGPVGQRDEPATGPEGTRGTDDLESVLPATYVRALTGLEPDAHGKVRCPLHEDRTPSLHVYPTAEQGWFCFGCRQGGSVFDLAAALWKRPVRGQGFVDLHADLLELLIPGARRP